MGGARERPCRSSAPALRQSADLKPWRRDAVRCFTQAESGMPVNDLVVRQLSELVGRLPADQFPATKSAVDRHHGEEEQATGGCLYHQEECLQKHS